MTPSRCSLGPALLLGACALLALASGCSRTDAPQRVSLEAPAPPPAPPPAPSRRLRVAIAAMISPKETYESYKDLMTYIGDQVGREVELVQREKYEEVNELLRQDLLDLAFVCTGAYVEGHERFGMELLVAPVTQGRTVYYSYTIVPADSPVRSLAELRGRAFAFTDPLSNTGRLAPVYQLAKEDETPERFFGRTTYTYSHDKSIESVARGFVDGAAVDSLIWEYMNRKDPAWTSKTKIIGRSAPYGIPPVVVSKAIDPRLREKLRSVFLTAHENERGREILSRVMIDRFVVVDDAIYDSVRAMKSWVERNAEE